MRKLLIYNRIASVDYLVKEMNEENYYKRNLRISTTGWEG